MPGTRRCGRRVLLWKRGGGLTLTVAIDCVMPPFGDITLIPMSTFLMLSTLPSFKKKCVVVPVSITSTHLVF